MGAGSAMSFANIADWRSTFFSGEFFGIFVYTLFMNKTENSRAGIADGFWDMALIVLAQAAGASFFFPAACFFGASDNFGFDLFLVVLGLLFSFNF